VAEEVIRLQPGEGMAVITDFLTPWKEQVAVKCYETRAERKKNIPRGCKRAWDRFSESVRGGGSLKVLCEIRVKSTLDCIGRGSKNRYVVRGGFGGAETG